MDYKDNFKNVFDLTRHVERYGFWKDKDYNLNDDVDFLGDTRDRIISYTKEGGYSDGAKLLKQLNIMNGGKQKIKAWQWQERSGIFIQAEYGRYIDNMPFLQYKKTSPSNNQGGKIIKILVNIGENSNIGADQILKYKTATILNMVDNLEGIGFRCEIDCIKIVRDCFNMVEKHKYIITFPLKKANEPINIGLMAHVFAPWFTRLYCISCTEIKAKQLKVKTTSGRGYNQNIEYSSDYDIIIKTGQLINKQTSEELINSLNKERQVA